MFKDEITRILNSNNVAYELTKYVNDDIFLNEFIDYTKPALLAAKYDSIIKERDERIIFMAFTFIALKHYDGKLWDYFYEYYESDNLTKKDIYNKIRINVFSQWVKGYHCDTNNREQTYQIPVIESIIPYNYAYKYVDFVFDIYDKHLDFSLENVDEELDLVFDGIRDNLTNDDGKSDIFENRDSSGSVKTYTLIQGTKRILRYNNFKNKVKQLKLFTKEFLTRIDNYYQQKNNKTPNYYFDTSFERWVLEHPEVKVKKKNGKRENYLRNRSPKFIFNTNNGKILLRTPMLRIHKKEDPSKIKVYVYENGINIYTNYVHVDENLISLMEIGYTEVEISNPFNKISCEIKYGEEILYSGNEILFRDNLFFNEEKEVKNGSNQSGKLYVVYKSNTNEQVSFIKSLPNYNIGSINITEENYQFIIDTHHYSFNGAYEKIVLGDHCKALNILFEEEPFKVFRNISSVVLVSKNKSIRGNYIRVNDIILADEDFVTKEQKNNIAYILKTDNLFSNDGFYNVKLIDKSTNHIVDDIKFILIKDIFIDQNVMTNNFVKVDFRGNCVFIYDDKEIDSLQLNINDIKRTRIKTIVNNNDFIGFLDITVPYFYFDPNNYNTFDNEIDKNIISTDTKLYFENLKLDVHLCYDRVQRKILTKKANCSKYIELAETKNHNDSAILKLEFEDFNNENYTLYIYNKPVFNEEGSNIFFDLINEKISITTEIDGFSSKEDIKLILYLDDIKLDERCLQSRKETNFFNLDDKKHNVRVEVGYETIDTDYETFEDISTFNCIYQDNFNYTPFSALMNSALFVKYLLCNVDEPEPESIKPPLFLKLIEKTGSNAFYCEGYYDKYLNIKTKLGKIYVEFDPIYISETNGKRRINAIVYNADAVEKSPFYYDCGKISNETSRWSDEIDYLVIEEDTPW